MDLEDCKLVKSYRGVESLHALLTHREQHLEDALCSFQLVVCRDGQLGGLAVCVHTEYGLGMFYVSTHTDPVSLSQRVRVLLADSSITKVTFCLKDQLASLSDGVDVRQATDVLLEDWLLDPDIDRLNPMINSISKVRLLEKMLSEHSGTSAIEEVTKMGHALSNSKFQDCDSGSKEAVEQAALALLLHRILRMSSRMWRVHVPLRESEMPLVPVLARMERTGMTIDLPVIQQQLQTATLSLTRLEKQAMLAVPSWIRYTQPSSESFDLRSPQRVSHLVYKQLRLPTPPTVHLSSPTSHLSVREEDLEQLRGLHPVVSMIMEHRQICTQLDAMRQLLSSNGLKAVGVGGGGGVRGGVLCGVLCGVSTATTARAHGNFQQTASVTGRIIVKTPSLQNIPKSVTTSGQDSFNIRAAFVAPPGCCIMRADYCQVELRMIAHFSGDRALWLALCKSDRMDPFVALASNWKKIAPDQVTASDRSQAKHLSYGMLYGMGTSAISQTLGVDQMQASALQQSFVESMPDVWKWIKRWVDYIFSCELHGIAITHTYIHTRTSTFVVYFLCMVQCQRGVPQKQIRPDHRGEAPQAPGHRVEERQCEERSGETGGEHDGTGLRCGHDEARHGALGCRSTATRVHRLGEARPDGARTDPDQIRV